VMKQETTPCDGRWRWRRRCGRFCVTTHATTHGGGFFTAHACKYLILKEWISEEVVGARGFELLPHSSVQYRRRSPGPCKQRSQCHFPPFPNRPERQQTPPNFDTLLHTHYTRPSRWIGGISCLIRGEACGSARRRPPCVPFHGF
jgi:hypothetical protein